MKGKEEKQKTIRAINDLGCRVTAADVAAKTGLSLSDSNKYLNLIASEVGGHLEVSNLGDIAYRFSSGFQNVYLATGVKAWLQYILNRLATVLFFVFKISFGLLLLISLTVVVCVIMSFMFMTSITSNKSSNRRDLAIDLKVFHDLLFWGTGKSSTRKNFFLNCFSVLFGDGDANAGIEEKQWQLIARLIRNNDGVVTSEQLAPYLFACKKNTFKGIFSVDEDSVFPVLIRFDGKPEVSERGSIVYVFPALQVSAENQTESETAFPEYLQEAAQPFSTLTKDEMNPVIGLACFNFLGTLWLAFTVHRLVRIYQFQVDILLSYGLLFVIIPMLRWAYLLRVNAAISDRNQTRLMLSQAIAAPDAALQIKLADRKQLAEANKLTEHSVIAQSIIYSTDKDALEQEFQEPESSDNKQQTREAE